MGVPDVSDRALEYYPYRFGRSGLVFRGPKRNLRGRYIAVIGGSETYGKFLREPYPTQVEAILGLPVVNFGCMHASAGVFAEDEAMLEACRNAEVTVIQIMGAGNNSNALYSVHPRRNDRFLKATPALRALYPRTDFAQFNFTRHLLKSLHERSPDAFAELRQHLRTAWTEQMNLLVDQIGGRIVLLWMSTRHPGESSELPSDPDPFLVDRTMLDALRDDVSCIVEVVASEAARDEGLDNKVFRGTELQAAAEVPGAQFHLEAALSLAEALAPIVGEEAGRAGDLPHARVS